MTDCEAMKLLRTMKCPKCDYDLATETFSWEGGSVNVYYCGNCRGTNGEHPFVSLLKEEE